MPKGTRDGLLDYGIALMVFSAIAKTVPLIAVIYGYSRLSSFNRAVGSFGYAEASFLENLVVYGILGLAVFAVIFIFGLMLLVGHSRRR